MKLCRPRPGRTTRVPACPTQTRQKQAILVAPHREATWEADREATSGGRGDHIERHIVKTHREAHREATSGSHIGIVPWCAPASPCCHVVLRWLSRGAKADSHILSTNLDAPAAVEPVQHHRDHRPQLIPRSQHQPTPGRIFSTAAKHRRASPSAPTATHRQQ